MTEKGAVETDAQNEYRHPNSARLINLMMGKAVNRAIFLVARLGIADLLKDEPLSIERLAEQTDSHAETLYRLMRALASMGIFEEMEQRRFRLTSLAEPLCSDAADSVRNFVMMLGSDWHTHAWSYLPQSVQKGSNAFGLAFGMTLFDYLSDHHDDFQVFNQAMTELSCRDATVLTEAYDFSVFRRVVDVGGGHGQLLAAILGTNAVMRGSLLEIAPVAEGAREYLKRAGVVERVEIVAGSGFDVIPAGGDAYLMKHVIQGWRDDEAEGMLRRIRDAIRAEGRLLIIETVIPDTNEPHPGKISDLEMLVLTPSGKERTISEYEALFRDGGFRLSRIVPTRSYLSIVEGIPI